MSGEKTTLNETVTRRLESYATALNKRIEYELGTASRDPSGALDREHAYRSALDVFYVTFPEVAKLDG